MMASIDDLARVPLFAGLSPGDLSRVIEIAKEVHFDPGRPVVEADKSGVGFHLVLDGGADVQVGGAVVATFGPGDYFGEMSVLDGKPRSATVVATSALTTLSIPAWNFESLLSKHPSMMRALLNELSGRIRRSESLRS
jgi:CRP-like cAMP-binding protein